MTALRNLKKTNETFNDVILSLLRERTVSVGSENHTAVQYARKTAFLDFDAGGSASVGVEFEYNDVKEEPSRFTLDLKIRKVFFGKRSLNPSLFFGVDAAHKHANPLYLRMYLQCVASALGKEFRIKHHFGMFGLKFEDIVVWRKIFYDFALSEDSFLNDVEGPLQASEERIDENVLKNIKNSLSMRVWNGKI